MLMERNLELVDNSAKEDDGSNASIYSTHFLIDFLPPTKKGQRECLPLLVKVNNNFRILFSLLTIYILNS